MTRTLGIARLLDSTHARSSLAKREPETRASIHCAACNGCPARALCDARAGHHWQTLSQCRSDSFFFL